MTTISSTRTLETNTVLRNTYMLLSMTLLVSAIACGTAMVIGIGHGTALMLNLAALAVIWLILPKTANSQSGIYVVFGFTALMGASLGPIINHYLSMSGGAQVVLQALAGTALVFFSLSGYVLTTRKDFNFMSGFLMTGLVVVIACMLFAMVGSIMGANVSALNLALSAAIVLLMSGFILFDTSRIVNGGETNYLAATVSLYLSIYNLFVSLLRLVGATSND
jgi:modulator of FtsH protease